MFGDVFGIKQKRVWCLSIQVLVVGGGGGWSGEGGVVRVECEGGV